MSNCPECDSPCTHPVGDGMTKCLDCGEYYTDDEDLNAGFEPSARNRTREPRVWDDDVN